MARLLTLHSTRPLQQVKMARLLTLLLLAFLSGGLSRSSCSSSTSNSHSSPLDGKVEEQVIIIDGTGSQGAIVIDDTSTDIVVGDDSSPPGKMGLNELHPSLIMDGDHICHSSSSSSRQRDRNPKVDSQTSSQRSEESASESAKDEDSSSSRKQRDSHPKLDPQMSSQRSDESASRSAKDEGRRQRDTNPKLDSQMGSQRSEESAPKSARDEGSSSMILLLNGELYTPSPIGRAHILLAGRSIVAIFRDEEFPWGNLEGLPVRIIDVNGSLVAPGLIDIHVHITGGGGEAGPASRTPEASLSELLDAGLTTVVGTLGTDCVSRSLENLRAKAAALKEEGLTAYMWSGCYRVPSPTLTGSLVRDLQLIEEVIGAGEIAISDHRGSWPTTAISQELLKIVSDARVGGMLSGKAGIAHFHTGAASSLLDPLWDVINVSKGAIPITQMIPTHISSRGRALLEAAETWIEAGGLVDLTSDQEGESASFSALNDWGQKGTVALDHISLSSDGFGSLPYYDAEGRLLKYGIASPKANLYTIQQLVLNGGWTFQQALSLSTANPAAFLSLQKKGKLEVGMDGDVVVLDAHNLQLEYVIATGQLMKTPTWTKTGLFGK